MTLKELRAIRKWRERAEAEFANWLVAWAWHVPESLVMDDKAIHIGEPVYFPESDYIYAHGIKHPTKAKIFEVLATTQGGEA